VHFCSCGMLRHLFLMTWRGDSIIYFIFSLGTHGFCVFLNKFFLKKFKTKKYLKNKKKIWKYFQKIPKKFIKSGKKNNEKIMERLIYIEIF